MNRLGTSGRQRIAGVIFLVLLGGVIAGYLATSGGGKRKPIPWRDVTAQAGTVRWADPTNSVIRNQQKLDKLFRVATLGPHPKPPQIDFGKRLAVLIATGPRSSTGYSLSVESVTEKGERIDVVVREHTPSLTDHVTPRLTFPFRLITLAKTSKHVHVRYAGRS